MFTHRRNQRSKGFKVKHALQLLFLLGVCIWLLYQVRRSHDKETTLSESSKSVNQVVKMGRKDLRPQREGISVVDARHKEEEGDEDSKSDEHNRSDENDSHNVGSGGEDDDSLIREHGLDKDEGADHGQETVHQDKITDASNETTDAEKNEEHTADDTEETENEDKKEGTSIVDQIEENEENVTEKIELNESENADDVSKVNRLEDSNTESEEKESDDTEENVHKEETEKEEENNVDGKQGENEVADSEKQEKEEKEEDEQHKIEDPITSDDHVQDGSDGKVEEAREEHYIRDNASSAVDHPNQHDPEENSTESNTKSAGVVDGTLGQSINNVTERARDENSSSSTVATHQGDGSDSEAKSVDDSREGSITESHHQLLEEDNSVSSEALDSSVQNGAESTSNTTDQQFETMHNTTSEGDNHDLQNTELKKTQESNSAAGNDQSDSTSTTTGATHGEEAVKGEFSNSTTNPDLQNKKPAGDESYSTTREIDEPSQSDKPDSNSTTGRKQENAPQSETNDDVHASKDGNLTSSENSANDGDSRKENQEAGQSEHINSSNKVSLRDNGSTEQNVNDGSNDENVTSSDNSAKENQEAVQDERNNASEKPTLRDNGNTEQNVNENVVETMTDGNENAAQNESSLENVNNDAGQDDKNKSTDSLMPQDVKEAHVDLETLPDTTAGGNHVEI